MTGRVNDWKVTDWELNDQKPNDSSSEIVSPIYTKVLQPVQGPRSKLPKPESSAMYECLSRPLLPQI